MSRTWMNVGVTEICESPTKAWKAVNLKTHEPRYMKSPEPFVLVFLGVFLSLMQWSS